MPTGTYRCQYTGKQNDGQGKARIDDERMMMRIETTINQKQKKMKNKEQDEYENATTRKVQSEEKKNRGVR